jgi:hypothetical protein
MARERRRLRERRRKGEARGDIKGRTRGKIWAKSSSVQGIFITRKRICTQTTA